MDVEGDADRDTAAVPALTTWFKTLDVAAWKFPFEGVNLAMMVWVPAVSKADVHEGTVPVPVSVTVHRMLLGVVNVSV